MKILLACDQRSDPALLATWLATRLAGRRADIDVLTVIPGMEDLASNELPHNTSVISIAESTREYRLACALVAGIATALQRAGLKSVRTHVEYGDPADVILASSRLWRSDLLCLGAPRRRGLLTAFRLDGVTRRLLRWSDCPVELLRAEQQPAAETICLLPVPADKANRLSLQRLQALPWAAGMRLHVLGVVPPGLDDGCETNAAAALLALQHAQDSARRAEALLQGLQAQLEGMLPKGTSVTCEVQAGSLRTLAVQRSRQLQSQLLLLSQCCFDAPAQQDPFLSLAPESLALAVDCSVLLLQDGNAAPLPQGRTEAARVLRLAR